MYLIDTNVWLERLLDQARSDEVRRLLDLIPSERLFISDFAFHSIAIVLARLKQLDVLVRFVQDAFVDGAVTLIHLEPEDMPDTVSTMTRFGLDFDDAYQYVAASKYGLTIVSFDSDFGRTERGSLAPADLLVDR